MNERNPTGGKVPPERDIKMAKIRPIVQISVLGGCINIDNAPPGLDFVIKDYDIDGIPENELAYDDDGSAYSLIIL